MKNYIYLFVQVFKLFLSLWECGRTPLLKREYIIWNSSKVFYMASCPAIKNFQYTFLK